ncbi:MAG: cellulase family glycosylhydrolase [Bacteroidales bacterium]|nr:cellulase family glycosylhydrolase [Bacteroidales bacterium]
MKYRESGINRAYHLTGQKPGIILFFPLLMFSLLLLSSGVPEKRDIPKEQSEGICVENLDKFIGPYGFMENNIFWQSWDGYFKWLDLLHEHHIHYAKFWLTPWKGNISWFFAWKIENGDATIPVNERIYDLYAYNRDYFENLKKFVDYACKKQIVVNLNVFDDCHLRHARNKDCNAEYHNIQGINTRKDWYSSATAKDIAKKFWKKVYQSLRKYPNVIYTVCNENYDFPVWQEEMASLMAKSDVFLDTGDSKITGKSKGLYSFVSIHGQCIPENISKHTKQNNLIFSSDGAFFGSASAHADLNKCIRAGVKQGKGYEFYVGTARGWEIEEIITRLGEESFKILGY